MDVTLAFPSLVFMITYCHDVVHSRETIPPRISESCHPVCASNLVCLEFTRSCTIFACNTLVTCVAPSQLPPNLRANYLSSQPQSPHATPSPGCPAVRLNAPCLSQCQQNVDCGFGMQCCFNGCGHMCLADSRVHRAPRRGSCPRVERSLVDLTCSDECSSDYQCTGFNKCCQSQCGRRCTTPCFHMRTSSSSWQLSSRCGSRGRRHSYRHSGKRAGTGTNIVIRRLG